MKKAMILPFLGLMLLTACQAQSQIDSSRSSSSKSVATYFEVRSNPIKITTDDQYKVTLDATDTWEFSVQEGQDVTDWLVLKSDKQALTDTSGVAQITAVDSDYSAITITIDSSKITGFSSNDGANLYIMPDSSSIVGTGDNHAHYSETSAKIGKYVIPKVSVGGTIEGEVTQEDGLTFTENQITFQFTVDGDEADSSLMNTEDAKIVLAEGDGYYTSDYTYSDQGLSTKMKNGSISYTIEPEDLQITNSGYELGENGGGRNWSEIGGDGNGNYHLNFKLSGLEYNGLPVSVETFTADVYCYGRTFEVDDGSIYANDIAKWSTTAENNTPVLCDDYTDDLIIAWANGFDASKLKAKDLTLTMKSQYGDTLTLTAGDDFTIETKKNRTTIHVNYTYWAYTPVYQTLTVDVAKKHLTWDEDEYKVDDISHDYSIASVYVYNVMAGGQTGTQTWTIYGLDGLENWQQIFNAPTYTLSAEIDGETRYYSEANGGSLVDEASATSYNASTDTNLQLLDNTIYLTRQYNQTEVKSINGQDVTFTKVYSQAESAIKAPKDVTNVTVKSGFILGDTWEEHLRWPWQTFINEGYQGGRS